MENEKNKLPEETIVAPGGGIDAGMKADAGMADAGAAGTTDPGAANGTEATAGPMPGEMAGAETTADQKTGETPGAEAMADHGPAAAGAETSELPDLTPAPPDHATVEAVMARIVADTIGDIPEPVAPAPPKKKKIPAAIKALLILAGALVLACGVVYIYYALSYRSKYLRGTIINGIDASDMTPEQVEEIIRARVEDYNLRLTFRDGEEETLSNEDLGFCYVPDDGAQRILREQNIFAWFVGYFDRYWPHSIGEDYAFDEEQMEEALRALPELSEDYQKAPTDACLIREGDYIAIQPETQGNLIVFDVLSKTVADAVNETTEEVDLRDFDGMYEKPSVYSDDPDLNLQMNDLNGFAAGVTTYRLPKGKTKVLERSTLIDWLSVKEDGYYYINVNDLKAHCEQYVAEMAAEVDQVNNTRVFHSTNFGDIFFDTDEWGYTIDQKAESEQLFNDLCNKVSSDREPAYSLFKEYDETFGGKYIEVDITNQRMYLYENGERVMATDCVTGTDNSSRRTITGIYSIYYMQRNRTLLGQPDEDGNPSYSSFVYYWMAFYGGYGLHDATWRSNFGGSIYKYSGSHGCVNLPYSVAKELYSRVEVGTPVIVFKM